MSLRRRFVRAEAGRRSLVVGSGGAGAHPRAAPALAAARGRSATRRVAAGPRPILAGAALVPAVGPPRLGSRSLPLTTARPGGRAHPAAAARLPAEPIRQRPAAALGVGPGRVGVPIGLLLIVVEDRLVGVVAGRTPRPHRGPAGLHRPRGASL